MTGGPTAPSQLGKTAAQLRAKRPSIINLQERRAHRRPSLLRAGHITPSSPAPLEPTPQGPLERPPSLGPATTPHLWAGVEDLHGNLLGRWVRAPGHAGLLDHGEEPPLRPLARPSRAPSAQKRGRRNRERRSAASTRSSHLARPAVALFQPCLPPPALSTAAAASSAPEGSASPPARSAPPTPPPSLPQPAPAPPLAAPPPARRRQWEGGVREARPSWLWSPARSVFRLAWGEGSPLCGDGRGEWKLAWGLGRGRLSGDAKR